MDKQQLVWWGFAFSHHARAPWPIIKLLLTLVRIHRLESSFTNYGSYCIWRIQIRIFHLFFLRPPFRQCKVTLTSTSWSPCIPHVVGFKASKKCKCVYVWALLTLVAMVSCRRGCPGRVPRGDITGSAELGVLTKQPGRHFSPVRWQTGPSSNVCLDAMMKAPSPQ